MTLIMPWIWTGMAISLTAIGHILYKYYAISQKRKFLIMTVLAFIMIPGFSFLALRDLSIAQVYLCTAMVPIFTTIGAIIFIKERITRHHIIGLCLITTGTFVYVYHSL